MTESASAPQNQLFDCPVKVRPGHGCEMPSQYRGAYVNCFVAAPNYIDALRLSVEALTKKGYIFDALLDGKVHQLDPLRWDEHIATSWSEHLDYFPPQADMIRFIKAGGVFFGPFCSWVSEENATR